MTSWGIRIFGFRSMIDTGGLGIVSSVCGLAAKLLSADLRILKSQNNWGGPRMHVHVRVKFLCIEMKGLLDERQY